MDSPFHGDKPYKDSLICLFSLVSRTNKRDDLVPRVSWWWWWTPVSHQGYTLVDGFPQNLPFEDLNAKQLKKSINESDFPVDYYNCIWRTWIDLREGLELKGEEKPTEKLHHEVINVIKWTKCWNYALESSLENICVGGAMKN